MENYNNPFYSFKTAFPYLFGFGVIAFGIYLVFFENGLARDFGFAIMSLAAALILHGLTIKKQ